MTYYDDLYVFDLDEYSWTKVPNSGSWPGPRAGHNFFLHSTPDTAVIQVRIHYLDEAHCE